MEVYRIENLSFAYPGAGRLILDDISLTVKPGEFLLIAGPSGSGKTSLLRHLKPNLIPAGRRTGQVYYQGQALADLDFARQAAEIAFVMQRAEQQIVTDKVWHELAFGLESLGLDSQTIRRRVAEMAAFFGISDCLYQDTNQLSGGQKQIINLASTMVMQPSVLILDEPTSQLDPIAASEFINILARINQELGTTIILTEHDLNEVLPLADRLIILDGGKIIEEGEARDLAENIAGLSPHLKKSLPIPLQIYAAVENNYRPPLTVAEGRTWLAEYARDYELGPVPDRSQLAEEKIRKINNIDVKAIELMTAKTSKRDEPIIHLDEVYFRYQAEGKDIIKGLSIKIYPGEFYGLVGANGAGKSTALALMAGLFEGQRGKLKLKSDRIALLPQDPQSLFLKASLAEDLWEVLAGRNIPAGASFDWQSKEQGFDELIELCHLRDLLDQHPYDLSGGEQVRLALAKVLATNPEVLLLDEPTKGLDAGFKELLADIFSDLQLRGVTIVMVSHDLEFLALHAQRIGMIFDGGLVSQADSQTFFAQNAFYTTAANRMARQHLPRAVTAEDLITACGGASRNNKDSSAGKVCKADSADDSSDNSDQSSGYDDALDTLARTESEESGSSEPSDLIKKASDYNLFEAKLEDELGLVAHRKAIVGKKFSGRLAALLVLFLVMPLTIYLAFTYLDDRKYLIVSLILILEAMLPMVFFFERRKPQARELVLLATMTALAVAGRAAFFMLPNFKPVVAIIIITGVALGAEAGFIVGVLTAFASNMFFGQGPWTPWQMLALGLIGFLAGLVFHRQGSISPPARKRLPLMIFGGLVTLVIYGGIMNPASVIIFQPQPTIEMFILAYASGLPFDLIHVAATVFFLYILAPSFLSKLERVKKKYGLMRN